VSFAAIILCVASQRVFVVVVVVVVVVISLSTQCGNFWIHPRSSSRLRAVSNVCGVATQWTAAPKVTCQRNVTCPWSQGSGTNLTDV